MREGPRVTVLMPMFNAKLHVEDAVRSVLRQDYRDFEILAVDDGSTDGTVDRVLAIGDPRVRTIRNPSRKRLSGVLNQGLDLARGEYVARMDADDICRSDRLAKQVAFMDAHPDVGLCGTWAQTFGEGSRRVYREPETDADIRAKMLFECPFVHPSVMIRRSVLEERGLRYNGNYYPAEDYEFWSRVLACAKASNLPDILLDYRIHGKSMTGGEWPEMDLQAGLVAQRELLRLGVDVDEDALRFHRSLGRGRSVALNSMDELARAERWLSMLKETNRSKRVFEEYALAHVLSRAWLGVCVNSSNLGFGVVARYLRATSLAGRSSLSSWGALRVLASVLRRQWSAARRV